jgi:hypothetical protein
MNPSLARQLKEAASPLLLPFLLVTLTQKDQTWYKTTQKYYSATQAMRNLEEVYPPSKLQLALSPKKSAREHLLLPHL